MYDTTDKPKNKGRKKSSAFELGGEELAITQDELLSALKAERMQSIGFEDKGDIEAQREQVLDYINGEMKDVPARANRSKVVSSDIADAVETILPDLMEIFTGGEDIGSFKPQGEDDEKQAQLETEFVNEVVFDQNSGFMVIQDAVRDALTVKVGVIKHYWEDEDVDEESFEGKTAMEVDAARKDSDVFDVAPTGFSDEGEQLFNFTAAPKRKGKEVIEAVDPQNFGVSPDTVRIQDTNYCVERSFPRAFQLLDMGYDRDKVDGLASSASGQDDESARSRDTVNESDDVGVDSDKTRRTVEIHTHTIRIDADGDGKSELWCVVTDAEQKVILDGYRKNRVGYSAGSPYPVAHRFYGKSVGDLLLEVQRIKTSLMRMLLDNGYFALNQRHEVAENKCSANTISDLLRNEPGFPVRSKTGDAVRPITSAGLNFDAVGALEYFSTVGEGRSGVVRNAQGLNPDTLHDTKGGALALMSAAQRRVRMVARILSETLLKGLFVGVHGDLREHCSTEQRTRFNNQWQAVSPTSWAARSDMTIEVGVGSGGRDMEIAAIMQVIGLQKEALEGQMTGAIKLPMVTEDNLYASASRLVERVGLKAPERYFTDPNEARQKAAEQAQQEGPGPEEQAAMAEMRMKQQEAEQSAALERQKAEAAHQLEQQKAQWKAEIESFLAKEKMERARQQAAFEAEMAEKRAMFEAGMALREEQRSHVTPLRPGGELHK